MSEYKQVFGAEPEAWREPLGALRTTLWDESAPAWQIERARNEVEWLCRVLNNVPGGGQFTEMKAMGEKA